MPWSIERKGGGDVKRQPTVAMVHVLSLLTALHGIGCAKEDPNPLVLLGTLERDRIALATPVQEMVLERPVHEGDHIRAGTVVARIDGTRLRAEVAIYVAARARAQAQLAQLQAGTTKERIAQADAE